MGKPRMIILIRHGQSEGNKDRNIHQTTPDHRVQLTPEGHKQAQEAGRKLRALLRPDDTLQFFTSPYRRTRETTEGILSALTADQPSPSPFRRQNIKVYEEPRLREQDFGNFQPCSAEMERMWQERADYGHFFYRIPNGESAADAYDRVSGFNESLWRLFGEDDFASVCVLVTHGLMTRIFLMKWYHWSVEYFEDLRNINHCEFVIMKHNRRNGKYVLQNQLRTWSELRMQREKELESRKVPSEPKTTTMTISTSTTTATPFRRKWGGCPDGCDHGRPATEGRRLMSESSSNEIVSDWNGQGSQAGSRVSISRERNSECRNSQRAITRGSNNAQDTGSSIRRANAPRSIENLSNRVEMSLEKLSQASAQETPFMLSSDEEQRRTFDFGNSARTSQPREGRATHTDQPKAAVRVQHRLGGRDGGGSQSGTDSLCPSDDGEGTQRLPHSRSQQKGFLSSPSLMSASASPSRSQDIEDDGDDEGSGMSVGLRRRRQLNLQPYNDSNNNNINNITTTATTTSQSTSDVPSAEEPGGEMSTQPLQTAPPPTVSFDKGPDGDDNGDGQLSTAHETHETREAHEERGQEPEAASAATVDGVDGGRHLSDPELEAERREDQSIRGSVF